VYFADNTRIAWSYTDANSTYKTANFMASSYTRDFPNQTMSMDERWYDRNTHAPLPVQSNATTHRVRDVALWGTFDLATYSSAFPSAYTPIVLFSALGATNVMLPLVAPLYAYGKRRGNQSNVLGYVAISLGLKQISSFLGNAKSTPKSAAFVYDGSFFLLGSSEADSFLQTRPLEKKVPAGCSSTAEVDVGQGSNITHVLVCRASIADYGHGALTVMASSHPSRLKPAVPTVSHEKLGGATYYVAASRITISYRGLSAYLLVLIPESDIIGDVVRSRNVAIGVTAALVVVIAVVSTAVVWLLLAPLSTVASRMVKAANLEDDGSEEAVSLMSEVAELQLAYYAMNEELNRIRSYVPQSVLVARHRQREGLDEEEEDDVHPAIDDYLERSNRSRKPSTRDDDTRSTRSSRHSRMRRGTEVLSNDSGVSTRLVSVLTANLRGLHAAAAKASSDALVSEISDAVTAIEAAVTERQGVLTFHGDRFLATFNTARPCASHATRAATAAVALTELPHAGPLRLKLTCGVATGPCVVGSMGSATMKTFCTVGAAVTDAATLERLTVLYGVQALATHRTCVDASSSCGVRYVDLVALASKDSVRAVAIAVLHSHTKDHRVADSGTNPVADEWMYVQHSTASDAASPFNRCFELLQRNDCEGALTLYRTVALECDKARETVHEDRVLASLLPPPRLQQMMDALLANSTVDNLVICRRVEQLHNGTIEKAV
jgi:class 3 adenylate cyclase